MKRFFKGFSYAWNGLRSAFSEQRNLKIHVVTAVVVVAAGFYFNLTRGEWVAIVMVIGFVFVAELFNTAIEYMVNIVSPQHQPSAGKIKDIAAGAVLVAACTAVIVGVIIFRKYIPNA
ncbi:diacylglycerol kinase family protein [soil metagenome]